MRIEQSYFQKSKALFHAAQALFTFVAGSFSLDSPWNATSSGRVLYALANSMAFLVPFKLLFDVPAGAAWHRLWSVRAARPNWLEWAALGTVLGLFLANTSFFFYANYPPGFGAWKWSFLPTTAMAVALGLALSGRWFPAWSGLEEASLGSSITNKAS